MKLQSTYCTRLSLPQLVSHHFLPLSAFLTASQAFYPIMIQRVYAAKDMKSVKAAGWALLAGPWLVMLAAVFVSSK